MMLLLWILLLLLLLAVGVVAIYIFLQGDAVLRFEPRKHTPLMKTAEEAGRLDFSMEIPFANIGKQEATLIDAYMRIYLPQEQYEDVLLRGKVNVKGVLREDDYFEAMLLGAGKRNTLVLRFEAYARNGCSLKDALTNVSDVDVALFVDCRGRGDLYTVKEYFTLTAEELRSLVMAK